MTLVLGATLLVGVLGDAAAARPSGDPSHPDASLEAVVDVRPVDGRRAEGLVRLSGRSDGTAHARGILLLLPAVQKVRVALAQQPCRRVTPTDGDLAFLGGPLEVQANAAVPWEHLIDLSLLRRARAVAVVGDFDGDGRDDLGACGELIKRRVAWERNGGRAHTVFASAEELRAPLGGGRLLAYAMADSNGPDRLGAVVTDLAPSTEHALGLHPDSCAPLLGTGSGVRTPPQQLTAVMTDAYGTARVHAGGYNFGLGDGSVRFASVVVYRPAAGGPFVSACAPLRLGTVLGDPKP